MNIANNPAYAFLFGADHPTKAESLIEQETESIESFAKRTRDNFAELLADERTYVQSVFYGLGEFTDEACDHALEDAVRLSDCITRASNLFEIFQYCLDEKRPFHEWNDALQKLRIELVSMFYLHREIEILRLFIPLASAKQRSQRNIPNMTPEGKQAAQVAWHQWREWAAALVTQQHHLSGNKRAIAEELKRIHGITQSIDTIRKQL